MTVVGLADSDGIANKVRSVREVRAGRSPPEPSPNNWRVPRSFVRRFSRAPKSRPKADPTPKGAVEALGYAAMAIFAGLAVGVGGAALVPTLSGQLFSSMPKKLLAAAGAGYCAGLAMGGSTGALGASAVGLEERWMLNALPVHLELSVVVRATLQDRDAVATGFAGFAVLLVIGIVLGLIAACCWLGGFAFGSVVGVVLGVNSSLFLVAFSVPVGASIGAGLSCLLGAVVGGMVGCRFWVRWLQDRFLYHPRRYAGDGGFWHEPREVGGRPYVSEKITYSFPGPVVGHFDQTAMLLRPHSPEISGLWVLFGGNGFLATDWLTFLDAVIHRGGAPAQAAYLLLDPPGYGWNAGRPSPAAVLAASRQALHVASEACARLTGFPPQVHILGHSLGAAEASQLACKLAREGGPLGTLLLSAPFLSIPQMAMRIVGVAFPSILRPVLPPILQLVVPHQWDNATNVPAAAKAGWRLSIIHGVADPMCPIQHGRELHRLASLAVTVVAHHETAGGATQMNEASPSFIEVAKAGHNDVLHTALHEYARLMSLAMRNMP